MAKTLMASAFIDLVKGVLAKKFSASAFVALTREKAQLEAAPQQQYSRFLEQVVQELKEKELPPKEQKAVYAYLGINPNRVQAVIKAGYKADRAPFNPAAIITTVKDRSHSEANPEFAFAVLVERVLWEMREHQLPARERRAVFAHLGVKPKEVQSVIQAGYQAHYETQMKYERTISLENETFGREHANEYLNREIEPRVSNGHRLEQ